MMLIGVTGTDGAGKGAAVAHLVAAKGFTHCSARQIWVEEIERRGLESTRANMRIIANDLRRQHGDDFLVTYYLKQITEEGIEKAAIESIRTMAEAETLARNGGVLLCIDADQNLRYERVMARKSSSDQITFEEFAAHEELEMDDPDPHGMQKAKVIAAADYTVLNNGTLAELHAQLDEVLAEIEKK